MAVNPKAVAKALLRAQAASPGAAGGFGGSPATINNGISPLVASYDQWTNGRPNGPGLPRDFNQFLAGSFGPLSPITPVPVDLPEPGMERAEPRRWQYQVGWNMPIGQPGNEGLKLASFANLRTVADAYSVARACIQVRSQEILSLGWEIGPTKDAEKKMRGDHGLRKDFDERRAQMKKFWRRPDPNYFSFSSWLNAVLEDILAVDALSIYLHPSRLPGKGVLKSNLAALAIVDGTTVRPLVDVQGAKPTPPNPAYQQYLYGVPRSDLMTVLNGEDVEDMGEAKVREYRGDQLLYLPYIARDWTPYGFPPIERALVPILSGLQRQQYQLSYFDEGSIPGMFISAGDPNTTPNQLRDLQDALNAMAGDPAWKHRIIVLPGGSKVDPIRPVPLADMFDQMIMTQVCMAFDVMPMELGITPQTSTTQSGGAANQMYKASEDINSRKALKPLIKWLAEVFNTIIQDVIGQTDMEWKWDGLEIAEDETAVSARLVNEIGHGLKSIDEGRLALGEQPWGLPITSDPVFFTASGVVPIDQPPPPPPGAPGAPGDPAAPAGATPVKAQPKPQKAATPAHSGAKENAKTTQRETGNASAAKATPDKATPKEKPKATEPEKVDKFAALRELDLIRRRIAKGGTLDTWQREHVPADVFAQLAADPDPERALTHARDVVKSRAGAERRARDVAVAEHLIVSGLRRTVDDFASGALSTAGFVDRATWVVKACVRVALGAGARAALDDLGYRLDPVTKAGKAPPKRLSEQYAGRYKLYAGTITTAYEEGYGLTTIASKPEGTWQIRWNVTSFNPCDLCAPRDGQIYNSGTLPGYPGSGGFGANATVCRGGKNCRCYLTYLHTPADKPAPQVQPPAAGGNATVTELVDRATAEQEANIKGARTALAATYPELVPGATVEPDPGAYDEFLNVIAARTAAQQRPYLEGLLQDLLTSQTRDANNAPPITIPTHRPAGGDALAVAGVIGTAVAASAATASTAAGIATGGLLTGALTGAAAGTVLTYEPPPQPAAVTKGKKKRRRKVYAYLAENYPPEVLEWVHDAKWTGPEEVDLDDVDMARRPGGARNMDKVKAIAEAVESGKKMDPIVLVKTPGDEKYQIADGFHRTLGIKHAGRSTVLAWVGEVDSDTGPWSKAMHERKLNKIDDHPGDGNARQLREYWTRGPGLARWVNSPHKWTALYGHLKRYIKDDDEAKRTAAAWFHEALGYWPGHQQGKNPVGPG